AISSVAVEDLADHALIEGRVDLGGLAFGDPLAVQQKRVRRDGGGGVLRHACYALPATAVTRLATSVIAPSSTSSAVSSCSWVITRGGCKRRTLALVPPTPISTPALKQVSRTASASAAAGVRASSFTSSTPIMRPSPRTSPMMGRRRCKAFRWARA